MYPWYYNRSMILQCMHDITMHPWYYNRSMILQCMHDIIIDPWYYNVCMVLQYAHDITIQCMDVTIATMYCQKFVSQCWKLQYILLLIFKPNLTVLTSNMAVWLFICATLTNSLCVRNLRNGKNWLRYFKNLGNIKHLIDPKNLTICTQKIILRWFTIKIQLFYLVSCQNQDPHSGCQNLAWMIWINFCGLRCTRKIFVCKWVCLNLIHIVFWIALLRCSWITMIFFLSHCMIMVLNDKSLKRGFEYFLFTS